MLSFWEQQTLAHCDFLIVGAGIMGCSVAFELRNKFPNAKIIILERGSFPHGASTKNAGFVCFGSPTEILSDFNKLGKDKTIELIGYRFEGLKILMERLGSHKLARTTNGGFEIITESPLRLDAIDELNENLFPVLNSNAFADVSEKIKAFGFNKVNQLISCELETQIDSGKMMIQYWKLLMENNIQIIPGAEVKYIEENTVYITTPTESFSMCASKILICTNAFINELYPEIPIKPGRGQVVLTNEIENLPFKGSFHLNEGYYYFRNVGKRVLFGGGRNTDFNNEETTTFSSNEIIIQDLQNKLREIILPNITFEIEQTWQGIMGFSATKTPVMLDINKYTSYVMACNGMGIALSPVIAQEFVKKI